ncbi:hypothetical protein N7470_001106 [Penicillium chermesinum]|nr:hypothetical protein N7470_001106 [Penicillium chermesinum]
MMILKTPKEDVAELGAIYIQGEVAIGPFSVLDFTAPTGKRDEHPDVIQGDAHTLSSLHQTIKATNAIMPEDISNRSPGSIIDSLSHMDEFLHWSDLLSFSPDQAGFASHPSLSMPYDLSFDLGQEIESSLPTPAHETMRTVTPQQTPMELEIATVDVLKDAQFLLKHFQDVVIPQIMAIPFGLKSPWRILNLPAAVVAFGDTTFLGTEGVSHARLANLYGLLACAAIDLARRPHLGTFQSAENWFQIASQTYQQAKDHLQVSLQHETEGPKKAKYKDQLMAANILTQYAKARLLHHVYTWLRIVGESTFVLHNYSLSYSCLEHIGSSQRSHASSAMSNPIVGSEPHSRLDDFLRLETQLSDSDLNIDEPKDRASGLHDIHLQDSRTFSETLYKQIYGIPETWLSLMSQTTRLANAMQTFIVARKSRKTVHLETWEALQRRSMRLENMICSFDLGWARGGSAELQVNTKSHACMLEALSAALVIFFYRRIRDAHPAVLQGHVDSVINSLEQCSAAFAEGDPTGPGTAWPVFIAGCEATTSARREAILRIIDKASSKSGLIAFSTARSLMTEVWNKQDEILVANRGEPMPSWIEIVKQGQIWPLFC